MNLIERRADLSNQRYVSVYIQSHGYPNCIGRSLNESIPKRRLIYKLLGLTRRSDSAAQLEDLNGFVPRTSWSATSCLLLTPLSSDRDWELSQPMVDSQCTLQG